MKPRSPDEIHRASTPLELLFDLVFVIAVANAGVHLHHAISENHFAHALISYNMVFFAIWWAWMNFSWFASAYDTDDAPYRLNVMLQLTGALVLAAGIGQAFEHADFRLCVIGYIIMRLALVLQWARAWRGDVSRRPIIKRYIIGLLCTQMAWAALVFVPGLYSLPLWLTLAVLELATPYWAEASLPDNMTPWHPAHIVERYGLFTIIVLGESILAATMAIQSSLEHGHFSLPLLEFVIGGVLIIFSLWWVYFQEDQHAIITSQNAFYWGYGHYFIFATAAAVGAGLAATIDAINHQTHAPLLLINASLVVPIILYLMSIGVVHGRFARESRTLWVFLLTFGLLIATLWTKHTVLLCGLIMAGLVGVKLWLSARQTP